MKKVTYNHSIQSDLSEKYNIINKIKIQYNKITNFCLREYLEPMLGFITHKSCVMPVPICSERDQLYY